MKNPSLSTDKKKLDLPPPNNLIPKNFDNPISPFVKKTNLQLVGSLCLKIDMFLTYSNFISNDNILPSFMLSNNNFDNIYFHGLNFNKKY